MNSYIIQQVFELLWKVEVRFYIDYKENVRTAKFKIQK